MAGEVQNNIWPLPKFYFFNLPDETGVPKMVWTLNNAWPTKVSGTDLNSEGNEVTVESLEIACETIAVSAPA